MRAERGLDITDYETICADADTLAALNYAAVESPGTQVMAGTLRAVGPEHVDAAAAQLKILPQTGTGKFKIKVVPRAGAKATSLTRWARLTEPVRTIVAALMWATLVALALHVVFADMPMIDEIRQPPTTVRAVGKTADAAFDELVDGLSERGSGGHAVSAERTNLLTPGWVNTLLMLVQGGHGEPVALPTEWTKAGFMLRPGAHPKWVLAPVSGETATGLVGTAVWPISAVTMGTSPPDVEATTTQLIHWAAREQIALTWQCPKAHGIVGEYLWPSRVIHICPQFTGVQKLEVLAHELSHHLQGKRGRLGRPSAQKDDEADAVAAVALAMVGLDVSPAEFPYLSRSGNHVTGIKAARGTILEMARELAAAARAGDAP
jgi:hypothetical protein